jgi:hypothetical protein
MLELPIYGYVLTYLGIYIYIYIYIFVSKIQLICHMATFDCAICHNVRPLKMHNHNGRWISIFQKKPPKNLHSAMY